MHVQNPCLPARDVRSILDRRKDSRELFIHGRIGCEDRYRVLHLKRKS